MAITTYAELQTALQNFLDDSSLATARVQECISLAEGDINMRLASLNITPTEARTTVSITGEYLNTSEIASSYVDVRAFEVSWDSNGTTVRRRLKPISAVGATMLGERDDGSLTYDYPAEDGESPPEYFAHQGAQFRFYPPPADGAATYTETYTGTIVYTTRLPALSDSNTTNWLLTAFPQLYLSAAMMWAEIFGWNDSRAVNWKALFEEQMGLLEAAYPRRKDETPLRHDLPFTYWNRERY